MIQDVNTTVTNIPADSWPSGFSLSTLVGKKWKQDTVLSFILALHRLLVADPSDPTEQDYPAGLLITNLAGSYYDQAAVADCFLALYRKLGTPPLGGAAPGTLLLDFHFPEAPAGQHWARVPDLAEIQPQWWAGLTPPFQAYAQPEMEKRIVCFATETSQTVKEFRRFDYPMDVSRIGGNGLRFKVSDYNPLTGAPELWVLAYQTRAMP